MTVLNYKIDRGHPMLNDGVHNIGQSVYSLTLTVAEHLSGASYWPPNFKQLWISESYKARISDCLISANTAAFGHRDVG